MNGDIHVAITGAGKATQALTIALNKLSGISIEAYKACERAAEEVSETMNKNVTLPELEMQIFAPEISAERLAIRLMELSDKAEEGITEKPKKKKKRMSRLEKASQYGGK